MYYCPFRERPASGRAEAPSWRQQIGKGVDGRMYRQRMEEKGGFTRVSALRHVGGYLAGRLTLQGCTCVSSTYRGTKEGQSRGHGAVKFSIAKA